MGHSTLSDTQISGLTRAGANQSQWAVYAALSRFHNLDRYPGNPSWCYRPIADLARITGLHPQTCAKALRALCTLEFVPGLTVLEKVGGGHRGQASIHADNLWQYSELIGQEPIGEPQGLTNEGGKGEPQGLTNEGGERYTDTSGKVSRESGKVSRNAPKGKSQGLTQNRSTEEIPRIDVQKDDKKEASTVDFLDSRRAERFRKWLYSRFDSEATVPYAAKWFGDRISAESREGFERNFRVLDGVADRFPTGDSYLTREDLLRVDYAQRVPATTSRSRYPMSVYDAWVLLTTSGRRWAAWAEALRAATAM